ncbi:SpoVA/SpoVAEb family sporulation membrane protein [Raoultibacter timonensis]|uniref:Stage V sporulation protein AC n=1 Tax=Raoultibacter timonensis TaxID=1907662 RepID=A0ABN6MJC5_9ACTN|nr:SpoVA/SpoVAEb family sporulation membrane protein [Raoultibacter timonensis]BDE97358.1 stage V sporulation protein AC [Raoultibacter timonensis]BDF51961.1 stage V sporulation protein AC [Raoultibacter timonensis]
MDSVKALVGSFIVGGILAMVGQAFMSIAVAVLGPDSFFLAATTLVGVGLVGAVLFVFGVYQKIEQVGGFGAALPFSGLAAAVAGTVVRAKEDGAAMGASMLAGVKLAAWVLGTGSLIVVIVGLVAFLIG